MNSDVPSLRSAIEVSPGGRIAGLASDSKHRFSKKARDNLLLLEGLGVEGDAHAGRCVRHRYLARHRPTMLNMRQLHLIPQELLDQLLPEGYDLGPGDLGENVVTAGLDLEAMPLGTILKLGPHAAIELTGLRTPCVLIDRFKAGLKSQMMIIKQRDRPKFRCGVMAIVRTGGKVAFGDLIEVKFPSKPWRSLPSL
jgi:MOSC domain-containing protein YiiM